MIPTHKNKAYDHIRQLILTGAAAPGSRLSDLAISREIGISRAPVREALGRLESEGLVQQIPHYGVFVRKLSRDELQDMLDLRIILESHAASRSATRITRDQLKRLDENCKALRRMTRDWRGKTTDENFPALYREMSKLDLEFHSLIIESAGNAVVSKIVADFRLLINLMSYRVSKLPDNLHERMTSTWQEHVAIVDALRKGSAAQASQAIMQHIESAKESIMAQYDLYAPLNHIENS